MLVYTDMGNPFEDLSEVVATMTTGEMVLRTIAGLGTVAVVIVPLLLLFRGLVRSGIR